MPITTELRSEHDLLLVLVDELEMVSSGDAPDDLTSLFFLLGRFVQLLQVHLLREDSVLYPAMISGPDDDAAVIALRFQEELGSLDARVQKFDSLWMGGEVSDRWQDFREELAGLLKDLRIRIQRENEELYPLVEGRIDAAA